MAVKNQGCTRRVPRLRIVDQESAYLVLPKADLAGDGLLDHLRQMLGVEGSQ